MNVAAIVTCFRPLSHAHVILENFLEPYLFNGKLTDPGVDVVSFFVDQTPENDMSQDVARQYRIPIFKTIEEALCLGGKELAVDAVLLIGEHGDYPTNKLGQRMYPRKQFFDRIAQSQPSPSIQSSVHACASAWRMMKYSPRRVEFNSPP